MPPHPPDQDSAGAGPSTSYAAGPSSTSTFGDTAGRPPLHPPYGPSGPVPATRPPASAAAAAATAAAAAAAAIDPLTLRFRDPGLESAYLAHHSARLLGVDRAAFLATAVLVLLVWLLRGDREECNAVQALTTLGLLAHAAALYLLQNHPECRPSPAPAPSSSSTSWDYPQPPPAPPPRRRIAYIAAVRLAYAAAYASFQPACRRPQLAACGPAASLSRLLVTDTALVLLLFQTIALPLPYRVHAGVSGAVVGLLLGAGHNADMCEALCGACHAAWFASALQRHQRLGRAARLAARSLGLGARGRAPLGPAHACGCSLLLAQLVAGFLLPGCVTYLMEEAARRRYLAGWGRRRQQAQRG